MIGSFLGVGGGRREDLEATRMVTFDDILMSIIRKTIGNSEINLDFLLLKLCSVDILIGWWMFKENPRLVP